MTKNNTKKKSLKKQLNNRETMITTFFLCFLVVIIFGAFTHSFFQSIISFFMGIFALFILERQNKKRG